MGVYNRKRVNMASKEPVGQTLSIYGSGLTNELWFQTALVVG